MTYRNGTYIAFDGLGQTDPILSDFKYYGAIQAWTANKNMDFKYVNSHDKTCAVRDSSLRTTLEARIRERQSNSKNMVVILSSDTRKTGSMLTYEIEKAVDYYKIPLIIAYVDYQVVAKPVKLSKYWPEALRSRIENGTAKAIHIPFTKDAILKSVEQFNVYNMPVTAMDNYSKADHRTFGTLGSAG
ncbi:TIR domain-containing protein [Methanosarcina sp. WWM596]|uniref:TIR domain-containing protein n=1 Tax=Methanosarcina sp. WWM596 TaxID=1434103 RepID=UPI00064F6815|nr:TIR domain-containing protein [Methanosarcina sp. WWM596]